MSQNAFEYDQVDGIVLYTDGSAIPNTGHYGSAAHGYVYRLLKEGEKPTTVNAMALTTNGYVLKNALKEEHTGVALVGYFDVIQSNFMNADSNTAEVEALVTALASMENFRGKLKQVTVISDSRYLVDNVTQSLPKWVESGWRDVNGNSIPGMTMWSSLHDEMQKLPEGCVFEIQHIKGHNDDLGNTRADYLARIGTNRSMYRNIGVEIRKELPGSYMKEKCSLHPLLSMRRVYFNTNPHKNSQGTYHQVGASGQNFILGKRSSEASYSVVRLKQPDPVLESIQGYHYALRGPVDSMVYLKTDRIRSADVYPWISEYGSDCLIRDNRTEGLLFLDKKPLTVEVSPGELPLQAMDALSHLNDILTDLEGHFWNNDAVAPQYEKYDITHHFYQTVQKQVRKDVIESKELLKEIKVGLKDIDIQLATQNGPQTFKLMLSDDIPERNVLKRLEELQPEIHLVIWNESPSCIRYASVVKVNDSISIWSNYFASRIFIKPKA